MTDKDQATLQPMGAIPPNAPLSQAIMAVQSKVGVTQDGIMGPITYQATLKSQRAIKWRVGEIMPEWYELAHEESTDGVKEIPGAGHNSRILEYHEATTLQASADETPWCSSFACWVMEQCGIKSTRSAAARSWLHWGTTLAQPQLGCAVVLQRGRAWQGHVGFYNGPGDTPNTIKLLGGNQSDSVCLKDYPLDSVLRYCWT